MPCTLIPNFRLRDIILWDAKFLIDTFSMRRKVGNYVWTQEERSYLEVRRRYSHLYISPDFTHLIASWVCTAPLDHKLAIDNPIKIVCENVQGVSTSDVRVTFSLFYILL